MLKGVAVSWLPSCHRSVSSSSQSDPIKISSPAQVSAPIIITSGYKDDDDVKPNWRPQKGSQQTNVQSFNRYVCLLWGDADVCYLRSLLFCLEEHLYSRLGDDSWGRAGVRPSWGGWLSLTPVDETGRGRTSQTDRHRLSRDLLQPGPREVVRNPAPSGRVNICVRREKKMKKTPRVNDRRGKQKRLQQEIKDLVNKTNWPDTEIRWLGNMVCAAETPLKNTQILRCESLASWIAAVTQTRMDFSRLFVRSWRRITSGPTLKPWRLLGTDPCLLRSSLKSRDTLKYRSWVSALCDFTLCLSSTLCQFFFVVHVNRVY